MTPRALKTEAAEWPARSVVKCGSPLPSWECSEAKRRATNLGGPAQPNTWRSWVASLVFVATAIITHAQSFTLESFTVTGGGGTSTGGGYTVIGTIGQSDAGTLSGASFTVQGGFWGVVSETVVTGSPELTIRLLSNGSVQICWPSSAQGFGLQDTPALSLPRWSPLEFIPVDDGESKCVTVPAPTNDRFFRLVK